MEKSIKNITYSSRWEENYISDDNDDWPTFAKRARENFISSVRADMQNNKSHVVKIYDPPLTSQDDNFVTDSNVKITRN